MILNLDKFQAIAQNKKKPDLTGKQLVIDSQQIKTVSSVEILRTQAQLQPSYQFCL